MRVGAVSWTAGLLAAAFAVAILVLGIPGASAHAPDPFPANEAAGNPAGLAGLTFKGPEGTTIENAVCEPIPDAVRSQYEDSDGNHHLGHILGVYRNDGGVLAGFLTPGSVDLFHFEYEEYSVPNNIEGPGPNPEGVILGPDGFFRGQFDQTITDHAGPDLRVEDRHAQRTYCIYGAHDKNGPFLFIHSTFADHVNIAISDLDLSEFYADLHAKEYPGQPVTMTWVMFVTSIFDDTPHIYPEFTHVHSDAPKDLTYADVLFTDKTTGPIKGAVYSWDFGDGSTGTGATPKHQYKHAGTYTVCMKITTGKGLTGTVCHDVTVKNRPPVAEFDCSFDQVTGRSLFVPNDSDMDGTIAAATWEFGDGAKAYDLGINQHYYEDSGHYAVTHSVTDDVGDQDDVTHICNVDLANRPPFIEAIGLQMVRIGNTVVVRVVGVDPDGDALTYSVSGLAPWMVWNATAHTITMTPSDLGLFDGFSLTVTDPLGLTGRATFQVLAFHESSDADRDGVQDIADNCPTVANKDQRDLDQDHLGDACDDATATTKGSVVPDAPGPAAVTDHDGDGVPDASDVCPAKADAAQLDSDADGLGDACDMDADGDGSPETPDDVHAFADNCLGLPNPDQRDSDRNGVGDACQASAGLGGNNACRGAGCLSAADAPASVEAAGASQARGVLIGAMATVVALAGLAVLMGALLRRQA